MQPQSNQTGPGGQSPVGTGGLGSPSPQQPELPMPQIATTPPANNNAAEMAQKVPDASTSSAARPLEYWVAEVDQILNKAGQNPKQKADAIAAVKQQYQQEMLGVQLPSSEGNRA